MNSTVSATTLTQCMMRTGSRWRSYSWPGRAVASVGCAGRITSFAETSDGRYLITLTGCARFRRGRRRWACYGRPPG